MEMPRIRGAGQNPSMQRSLNSHIHDHGEPGRRLNEQGFRIRNTKRLPNADGNDSAGSRLFTNASVRVILHNPFYAGFVKYNGEQMPGIHESVIGSELFEAVQVTLRKNICLP